MAVQAYQAGLADAAPQLRRIGIADLAAALRAGWQDFMAAPTQILFLCVIYPVFGFVLARAAAGGAMLPLVWPLLSGFALVGPLAALGLYEISRRREQGLPVSWRDCFRVLQSPSLGAMIGMGAIMVAIFAAWILTARGLFALTLGSASHADIFTLLGDVFDGTGGIALLLLGNLAGALFAVLVLAISVVSLPLLLDRPVSLGTALDTSWRAFRANMPIMLVWGLIVAAGLAFGMATLLVGLAVTLPLLGHATWHLYRRVVV